MADDEIQVRDWLRSVEAPPPGLEVGEIVQLARSRVRRRRLFAAGATAAAVVAVAATVPAAAQVWQPPTEAGPGSLAEHLPVVQCSAVALDDAGESDPAFAGLVAPDGYAVETMTASEQGDVVGTVRDGDERRAVALWPATDPDHPQVLAAPGDHTRAADITDDGAVLANRHGPDPGAYWWNSSGTGRPLPVPAGAEHAWVSSGSGRFAVGSAVVKVTTYSVEPIPENSLIAELARPGEPEFSQPGNAQITVAVRWDLRAGTVETLDPLGLVEYGVSSRAVVVTATGDPVIVVGDTPLLYDGELVALSMSPTQHRFTGAELSADGTLLISEVANGEPDQRQRAVWRC